MLLSLFAAGCSCSGGRNRTDSEYVLDMMSQKSLKAQEGGPKGEMLMRLPPEGARARNRRYYPYAQNPEKAKSLKNPLKTSPQIIQAGKKSYEKFCIYCHGRLGGSEEGATVAPKMIIKPPSLLTDKAKALSDGEIYHIIYEGRGLMGSYRIQLETAEQLAFSRYIESGRGEKTAAPGGADSSGENSFEESGRDAAGQGAGGGGSDSIWSVVSYVRALQGGRK